MSLRDELSLAHRPSKRIRRLIYAAMPKASVRSAQEGADYLVSPLGVVFVVANETVITVFTLDMTKERIRSLRRFAS